MHVSSSRGAAARLAFAVAAFTFAAPALAEGGTIKGKVDATPPKWLEDTVVYLKEVPGTYPPKTHALDQKGMRFLPHVMTIVVGDTVKFLNHDSLVHNVYSPDGEGYNLGSFKQDEVRTYTFSKPGTYSQLELASQGGRQDGDGGGGQDARRELLGQALSEAWPSPHLAWPRCPRRWRRSRSSARLRRRPSNPSASATRCTPATPASAAPRATHTPSAVRWRASPPWRAARAVTSS